METIKTEIPDDSKPTDAAPVKKSILGRPKEINPKPRSPKKRKEPTRPRGRPKKEEHEKKTTPRIILSGVLSRQVQTGGLV